MICVVYYESKAKATANILFKRLKSAYKQFEVILFNINNKPKSSALDYLNGFNLIIVVFSENKSPCPEEIHPLIKGELKKEDLTHCVPIIPISTNQKYQHPPQPLSGIKSMPCFDASEIELLAIEKRVGVLLGLKGTIFISYANSDGEVVAKQFKESLNRLGFPWLDKERLKGGENVQAVIEYTIKKEAGLLVILDTPAAVTRENVYKEIWWSLSYFVPVLPIVFRDSNDHELGTRFPMLRDLQRWVEPVTSWNFDSMVPPLDEMELKKVLSTIENYLFEIQKWRIQLPHKCRETFQKAGFDQIDSLDEHSRMYLAQKKADGLYLQRILYHCALFNPTFREGLKAVCKYDVRAHCNYRFIIHKETKVPDLALNYIISENPDLQAELRVIPLQELLPFLLKKF